MHRRVRCSCLTVDGRARYFEDPIKYKMDSQEHSLRPLRPLKMASEYRVSVLSLKRGVQEQGRHPGFPTYLLLKTLL